MKKLLFSILALLCVVPFAVSAKNNKVKVYIFEAGGCPYCEAEIEYLEGLDSYNEKFEIIRKELYIDHIDWERGADYELGYKVANAFNEVGFADATYQGTPLVVISDLYAASAYSTSLESVINEAYEKGDKDIVGCFEQGNDDCLDYLKETNSSGSNATTIIITVICSAVLLVTYLIKSSNDRDKIISAIQTNKKNNK